MQWMTSRATAIARTIGIPSESNGRFSGADKVVEAMGVLEEYRKISGCAIRRAEKSQSAEQHREKSRSREPNSLQPTPERYRPTSSFPNQPRLGRTRVRAGAA